MNNRSGQTGIENKPKKELDLSALMLNALMHTNW